MNTLQQLERLAQSAKTQIMNLKTLFFSNFDNIDFWWAYFGFLQLGSVYELEMDEIGVALANKAVFPLDTLTKDYQKVPYQK